MKFDEIEKIVELMSAHNLTEFKIDAEDIHLCLRRDLNPGLPMPAPQQLAPVAAPAPAVAAPVAPEKPAEAKRTINSPIIGTFYRAASPEAEPFAKVGDKVTPDSVVCIIEAMKVMNEIKAETSGVIKAILLDNAVPVEYGQPMFELE